MRLQRSDVFGCSIAFVALVGICLAAYVVATWAFMRF